MQKSKLQPSPVHKTHQSNIKKKQNQECNKNSIITSLSSNEISGVGGWNWSKIILYMVRALTWEVDLGWAFYFFQ